MKARFSLSFAAVALLLVLGVAAGCNKTTAKTDAQISSEVQSKFSQDSGLQDKGLNVQAANGVVTLSGTVDNDVEREAAARQAASVEGVKTVVNNLQVVPQTAVAQTPVPPAVQEAAPAPKPRASTPKRRASHSAVRASEPEPEVTTRTLTPTSETASNVAPAGPAAPVAPPPPQKVTIPVGTTLAVRLVDTIDSETATQGQTFHATLDSPLAVEGDTAIPAGHDVEGHVVDVKSAGKFAGQSLLVLQLDRITAGGKNYSIQTDQWRRQGSSRTKNTAAKVGTGAAIGAIIGGIAGGGKGAAIGAAAGGGLGGGVQAATHGQQIKVASETVLNFTLQSPLTVIPTTQGPNAGRPKLENN
jgi:outer membrane biosynthesis protein TonB